jgi:hypothetical protein
MQGGNRHLGKITGDYSSTVPPSAAGYCTVVTRGDAWWRMLERINQDRTISLKAAVEN